MEASRNIKRVITKRLTLEAGDYSGVGAAGKIFTDVLDIPKEYDEIIGWGVVVGDDDGVANADYEVAIDDENGDLTGWDHIGGVATGKNDGCSPDERLKSIGPWNRRTTGQLTLKGKIPAQNLASDLKITFRIEVQRPEIRQ